MSRREFITLLDGAPACPAGGPRNIPLCRAVELRVSLTCINARYPHALYRYSCMARLSVWLPVWMQTMFSSVDIGQGDKKGAVVPRAFFPALFLGDSADTPELRGLTQLATKVPLRAGRTIFEEGEQADSAFGVSQGVVRLYKLLPDGRRHIVAFALPSDFLGMPLAERHGCWADAIGEVSLCRFSRDELEKLIAKSPKLTRLVLDFAARKLNMARDQLLLLGNGSAEEKVAIFLVDWRKRLERLVAVSHPLPTPLPMPRQDIADFLGLKLETVSRTLAKLEQKNVIRLVPKGVFLNGLEGTALVTGRSPPPRAGNRWIDDTT